MYIAIRIFTIYMLILSLSPCGDGGSGIVELTKHYFGIEHNHISDHEQHSKGCGDDTCTPFCVCSCCSMSIDLPTKIPYFVKHPSTKLVKFTSLETDFTMSSYILSIWHPPKFS